MKECVTCWQKKPYEEFHKRKDSADGYVYSCKPCTSKKRKEYHERSKESVMARQRQWYYENERKILEIERLLNELKATFK